MSMGSADAPLTVAQLNRMSRESLEQSMGQVWVKGELTALSKPSSGHWYFTLKDEMGQISCALFKYRVPKEDIKVGSEILVLGAVTLYEARGQYQMVIESVVPWGLGSRHLQFEALKKKLHDSGVLDARHKKVLPKYPSCIGIISSAKAAGFQDVLVILKRRFPLAKVRLYPTLVQGDDAPRGIVSAINAVEADREDVDVVMLVRGGGGPEDLWCFNDESVVMRILEMTLPIITGIGHEIDSCIADLVADVRSPTPSAAAETVVPDMVELQALLDHTRKVMGLAMYRHIERLWMRLDSVRSKWILPKDYLLLKRKNMESMALLMQHIAVKQLQCLQRVIYGFELRVAKILPHYGMKQAVMDLQSRFYREANRYVTCHRQRLQHYAGLLEARDPEKLLQGGWGYIDGDDGACTGIKDMSPGSLWRVWVRGGSVDVVVEKQNITSE